MARTTDFEDTDRCLCGHSYDNHISGGRCGEACDCSAFVEKDHRVMRRLDGIAALLEQLVSDVADLKRARK